MALSDVSNVVRVTAVGPMILARRGMLRAPLIAAVAIGGANTLNC